MLSTSGGVLIVGCCIRIGCILIGCILIDVVYLLVVYLLRLYTYWCGVLIEVVYLLVVYLLMSYTYWGGALIVGWCTCWICCCGYILWLMIRIMYFWHVVLVLKWISIVDFILWSWYSICTWFMYDDWLCGVGIGLSVLILWIILPSWVACVTLR